MTMKEVIDKVSDIYREERGKLSDLDDALKSVLIVLNDVNKTKGRNITLSDYNILIKRKEKIIEEIQLKRQYCEGISCVRELLMDLGFDTDVSV